jgi:enoyl-CoA hydratase/carnithine racemase
MNVHSARSSETSAPVLLRERDGDVAVLTLNRPQARNSLSEALLIALSEAFSEIGTDKTVRAVVLAANGTAFCAGHDMKELTARRADADGGRAYFSQIMTVCSGMMQMIVNLPQPVIAAVQGPASAAGCQLVASCDLAIASAAAKFATPGVDIGLFCSTPMVALSRNVARKHAMEMLLTGEMVAADDAARIGLINRVVAAGEERQAAVALAKQFASKSSYVLKIGKHAFYRQAEMGLAAAYAYASEVMTENMMARDAEEGLCAFIEKREPKWQDE